jgi:hypothetical protein
MAAAISCLRRPGTLAETLRSFGLTEDAGLLSSQHEP